MNVEADDRTTVLTGDGAGLKPIAACSILGQPIFQFILHDGVGYVFLWNRLQPLAGFTAQLLSCRIEYHGALTLDAFAHLNPPDEIAAKTPTPRSLRALFSLGQF